MSGDESSVKVDLSAPNLVIGGFVPTSTGVPVGGYYTSIMCFASHGDEKHIFLVGDTIKPGRAQCLSQARILLTHSGLMNTNDGWYELHLPWQGINDCGMWQVLVSIVLLVSDYNDTTPPQDWSKFCIALIPGCTAEQVGLAGREMIHTSIWQSKLACSHAVFDMLLFNGQATHSLLVPGPVVANDFDVDEEKEIQERQESTARGEEEAAAICKANPNPTLKPGATISYRHYSFEKLQQRLPRFSPRKRAAKMAAGYLWIIYVHRFLLLMQ